MKLLTVLSRIAIGLPFVWLGYQAAKEPGPRVQMATKFGVPEDFSEVAVRANGAVMAAGGLAVATGLLPTVGAAAVATAMVPTTLAGHAFWNDDDPAQRAGNTIQFLKNLGLIGGLLAVVSASNRPAS